MLTIENKQPREIVGLTVKNPVVEHVNKYTVEMVFEFSVANNWKYLTVAFSEDDQEKLIAFLNFLRNCSNRYANGKGGCESYGPVPGYLYWVFAELDGEIWDGYDPGDEPDANCPVLQELSAKFGPWEEAPAYIDWPKHEWEYWYSFEKATVFWHDSTGLKHEVSMETK